MCHHHPDTVHIQPDELGQLLWTRRGQEYCKQMVGGAGGRWNIAAPQLPLSHSGQRAKEYLGINYRALSQITSPALDVMQNILIRPIKIPLFNRSRDAPPAFQEAQQHIPVPISPFLSPAAHSCPQGCPAARSCPQQPVPVPRGAQQPCRGALGHSPNSSLQKSC